MGIPTTDRKIWTILDLITWGTEYLTEKSITDSRLNIELMLAHVLRFNRMQLYTNFDKPLTDDELAQFKLFLKRRLTHEPLQYILGETEFMGLKFAIDRRVLIPRSDTEILVEEVIKKIKADFEKDSAIQILEIGTGSGCIAISLVKMLYNVSVVSIDKSDDALQLAAQNAETNSVNDRITFRKQDFLTNSDSSQKYHCIVSNPPYISTEEYLKLEPEVREFEPKIALADDKDGLTFYHLIAGREKDNLLEKGFVAVEHSYNQSDDVQKIFSKNGWKNIRAIKDYSGNFRCV
ncbi:MAG: peptide chain release factor N(5)-glutamine methyltransferase, partial [Bacteroidota bacterium]|nr:peptide chain release factor N(5)-glutamine methyltransferase [Bacteroidota bacterium]